MTGQQRQERLRAATVALARLNTSILISNQTLAAELILNAADEAVPVVAESDYASSTGATHSGPS